jgi:hypothetical protein
MKRFRISELLFLMIGIILIASSMLLMKYEVSLVKLFNLHLSPGDPFQASYYSTPEVPSSPTPVPTQTPMIGESTKLSVYLTSPANLSKITRVKSPKTPQMLVFKFEVYPKRTESTFELLFKDKVVSTSTLPGNGTGMHEVSIPLPSSGLYQWRVKTTDITSELRTLILRD